MCLTIDYISFKFNKTAAKFIATPLNVIFQLSMFKGTLTTFPPAWKNAVVIPLNKTEQMCEESSRKS